MHKAPDQLSDNEVAGMLLDPMTERTAVLHLYSQHLEPLAWFVRQNGGTQQDAEDVFQEVVVSFVQLVKAGKFRGESSIRTLLYTINRNVWFNEIRRRTAAGARDKHFEQAREAAVDDNAMEELEARSELFAVIERLGEDCKRLLVLFYYENLSMKEILMRSSYGNEQVVRNKKYKCMKKLGELIEGNAGLLSKLKMLFYG